MPFQPVPRHALVEITLITPAGKGGISAQTLKAVPFDLVHAVAGYADILPDILQTLAAVVVAAYPASASRSASLFKASSSAA